MEPVNTYEEIPFDEIPLDDNTVNPVDTTDLLGRNKKFVDAIMTIIRTKNSVDYPPNGPSMYEQLKEFFMGEWLDTRYSKKQPEVFNEEAFQRFLDSTNKMSVNQLYRN